MFDYAEKFWRENPGSYDAARAKFEMVIKSASGTVYYLKAQDAVRAIARARATAVETAFEAERAAAAKLAAGGDYDAALELLGRKPGSFAKELRPRLKTEAASLRAEAEKKLGAALAAAEKGSADGEPRKGLAELAKVAAIRYAPWKAGIEKLRARLEQEKQNVAELARKRMLARARKRLDALLDAVDALVFEGKGAEAAARLKSESGKFTAEERAAVAVELEAASGMLGEIDGLARARAKALADLPGRKVTLKTGGGAKHECVVRRLDMKKRVVEVEREYFMMGQRRTRTYALRLDDLAPGELARLLPVPGPTTGAGHVAAALLAMAAKDYAAAGAALKAAGEHPLVGRYAKKLQLASLDAAEAAAQLDWERTVLSLAGGKLDLPGARKLLEAIRRHLDSHAKTRFVAGNGAEVEKLRARAQKVIDDSPEGMATKVRRLFKGKLVRFDSRTMDIELLYDFGDPAQLADWRTSSGWGSGNTKPLVDKGALSMPGMARYLLHSARLTMGKLSARFDATSGRGQGIVTLMVCADGRSKYYGLFPLTRWKSAALSRGLARGERRLGQYRPSPFAGPRKGSATLEFGGGRVKGTVGSEVFDVEDKTHTSGHVALSAHGTWALFDDVRIVGRLDRAWLERELRRAELRETASGFKGTWQKIAFRGKTPRGRGEMFRGMIYDSKRKLCVLWGGHWTNWNDLWTLDLSKPQWTCLQTNDAKAPGVGRTRPPGMTHYFLTYDAGNDLYWIGHHWAYNPKAGAWRKNSGSLKKAGKLPYAPWMRCAMAYDPQGKRFLWWKGSGAFLTPGTDAAKRIASGPPHRSYPDGGLVYDRKSKVFVLFGGHTHQGPWYNDTWTYDPAVNRWRECRPEVSPPERYAHRLHWHAGLEAVIMCGGNKGKGKHLKKVWVYETVADRWTQAETTGGEPSVGGTTYDAARDVLVVFNGRGETWTLKLERTGRPRAK
jgi:hypothetical protein